MEENIGALLVECLLYCIVHSYPRFGGKKPNGGIEEHGAGVNVMAGGELRCRRERIVAENGDGLEVDV